MDAPQPPAAAARPLLYFVHWQRAGADERAARLASWGYDVRYDFSYDKDELDRTTQRVLALRPDAIVMSLDEFPGYTRSFAQVLKARSGLHKVPRLVVGGETDQVALTQQRVPEATYTTWESLPEALTATLGQEPPAANVPPIAEARAFL